MSTSSQRPESCFVTPKLEPYVAQIASAVYRLINGVKPAGSNIPPRSNVFESISGHCDGFQKAGAISPPCSRCPARVIINS